MKFRSLRLSTTTPSVRGALLRVVESAGYAAETFASAREFLAWLPEGRAACLVLDVHMDELSGFDLYDRLAVPVVFITGHDDPITVARIEASTAVGHLGKPFDRGDRSRRDSACCRRPSTTTTS